MAHFGFNPSFDLHNEKHIVKNVPDNEYNVLGVAAANGTIFCREHPGIWLSRTNGQCCWMKNEVRDCPYCVIALNNRLGSSLFSGIVSLLSSQSDGKAEVDTEAKAKADAEVKVKAEAKAKAKAEVDAEKDAEANDNMETCELPNSRFWSLSTPTALKSPTISLGVMRARALLSGGALKTPSPTSDETH
jgi:hypothetical protein